MEGAGRGRADTSALRTAGTADTLELAEATVLLERVITMVLLEILDTYRRGGPMPDPPDALGDPVVSPSNESIPSSSVTDPLPSRTDSDAPIKCIPFWKK